MNGFNNPLQMVVTIAKYASSFTSRTSHLEGEEVFGSCKQCTNLPLGLVYSHRHNCVFIFHLQIDINFIYINYKLDVDDSLSTSQF
jgi:hypothetical protein